jgi:hypothetical protein
MTTMLHALPGATGFDLHRQLGELASVTGSAAGSAYLAEACTGWSGDSTLAVTSSLGSAPSTPAGGR